MAGENPAFLGFVRTLPCCAPGAPRDCAGWMEANHAGRRGVGQRSHDEEAIPLCSEHHRWAGWTNHLGPFQGWTRDERRAWADERIAETQMLWAARRPESEDDMTSADLTEEQRTQIDAICRRAEERGYQRVKVRVMNDDQRLKDGKNGFYLELEAFIGHRRFEATAGFDRETDVSMAIAALATHVEG
jgi:hypothetical protein